MSQSIDKFQELLNMIDHELEKTRDLKTDIVKEKADLYLTMYLPNEMREFFGPKVKQIKYTPTIVASGTASSTYDKYRKLGLDKLKNLIENVIEYLNENEKDSEEVVMAEKNTINKESNKVFIVHGHEAAMKSEVARFVEKMGLESIILSERPDQGNTIISKFQKESQDIRFAIVLLSEDDQLESGQSRTRQNVIFELGYFIGKLGSSNVVLLKNGEPEIPSDLYGVLYQDFKPESNDWKIKIATEMKSAGIKVNLNDAF